MFLFFHQHYKTWCKLLINSYIILTEIYTIDGNAFGRPCHFPFLYEKKWYADCTKVDEQNQRLWCSIETDYSVNQLWGYCPTLDSRSLFQVLPAQ